MKFMIIILLTGSAFAMLKSPSIEERKACFRDCDYRAMAHVIKRTPDLEKICLLDDSEISIDTMSKHKVFGSTLEEWSQTKFYFCTKSTMPAPFCKTNLCK